MIKKDKTEKLLIVAIWVSSINAAIQIVNAILAFV